MKNVKFYLASLCVAVLALSCEKAVEIDQPSNEVTPQLTTITCAFPTMTDQNGTKVTLDAAGHTGWEEGDKIVIYGKRNHENNTETPLSPVIHTLTAAEIADPKVAVFTEDISGLEPDPDGLLPYNAAYPADDWGFYSMWYSSARARFSETNQLLLAGGMSDSGVITLNNLCGAIMFKVAGDFDEYRLVGNNNEVVGYEDYLVEVNVSSPNYLKKYGESYGTNGPKTIVAGPVNGDGATVNYIFIPNEVSFSGGFTIRFYKSGSYTHYITTNSSFSLTHGHCVNLGLLPSGAIHEYVAPAGHDATHPAIAGAVDLGSAATANCYIVDGSDDDNADKVFKFKAVKGNSDTGVGEINSVVIYWETYNNASTVSANSVIAEADFDKQAGDDDYWITFKMPSALHEGNALIAAKDASDNILWSWHIWVPATTVASADYGIYTAGKNMMDRNLGALKVVSEVTTSDGTFVDVQSIGLVYQWGRKDPFLGPDKVKKDSYRSWATYAGQGTFSADARVMSLAESIQNPTLLATGTSTNKNWISPYDKELWGDSGDKSQYDPCPPGYRVPKRDSNTYLWGDNEGTYDITNAPNWAYDNTHYWFTMGNPATTFPCSGYRNGTDFKTTFRTIIWNSHLSSYQGSYDEPYYSAYNRRIEWGSDAIKIRNDSQYNSLGCSVRCVAE